MTLTTHMMDPEHLFTGPFDPTTPYATRENSRDGYPGVMHPLDLTTVSVPADRGMRRCLRDVGMWKHDPPGLYCNRVIEGRMYVNISWVLWHADALPGIRAEDFEAHLFGQHVGLKVSRPAISRAERLVAASLVWRLALGYVRVIAGRNHRLASALQARRDSDFGRFSDAELAGQVASLRGGIELGSDWNTRASIFAMTCVSALTRAAGPELFHMLLPLLSDVGDVESAAPARRLRELAREVRRDQPELIRLLSDSPDRWSALATRAPGLKVKFDALLRRYGYRSVAEFCISAPSWADDPAPTLDAFVGLLQQPDGDHERQHTTDLRALLRPLGPVKRLRLRLLARAARLGAQTREVCKAALIIRVDIVRRFMREVGRRMVASGAVPDLDAFYMLTLEEVIAYLAHGRAAGLVETARARQATRDALAATPEPPDLMLGLEPLEPAQIANAGGVGAVMTGMAVSGGIVEGIARVVHGTDALDAFEPDEILVAPYTDAGWTPYFTMASAVIVENGGLLTHTSVIARELGLPAVVNVRNATMLIQTGDRLRLDANTGEVRILARADTAPAVA